MPNEGWKAVAKRIIKERNWPGSVAAVNRVFDSLPELVAKSAHDVTERAFRLTCETLNDCPLELEQGPHCDDCSAEGCGRDEHECWQEYFMALARRDIEKEQNKKEEQHAKIL